MESEIRKQKKREYRLRNKDIISRQKREYRLRNKDIISRQKREYGLRNKDVISRQHKEYREKSAYNVSKLSAKRRGIYWGLTEKEYIEITSKRCKYCWNALSKTGIRMDRIDLEKHIGYMFGNVVPCCPRCNTTRMNNYTYDEMLWDIAPVIRKIDDRRRRALSIGPNLVEF